MFPLSTERPPPSPVDRPRALTRPQADAQAAHGPAADERFRHLLGDAAWFRLPTPVRERFSRHLGPSGSRHFVGAVISTEISRAGRLLALAARLAGGPLPDTPGATGPATVTVREDAALGGQIWTRTYARPGRFPQTINSVKRFRGATGLEEYLGFGLTMALTLHCEDQALVFRSAGYGVEALGRHWRLPAWLSPGVCTITHRALDAVAFTFTLDLVHPRLGRLLHQEAVFRERVA